MVFFTSSCGGLSKSASTSRRGRTPRCVLREVRLSFSRDSPGGYSFMPMIVQIYCTQAEWCWRGRAHYLKRSQNQVQPQTCHSPCFLSSSFPREASPARKTPIFRKCAPKRDPDVPRQRSGRPRPSRIRRRDPTGRWSPARCGSCGTVGTFFRFIFLKIGVSSYGVSSPCWEQSERKR